MQKLAKKSPSGHHRTTCRAVSSQLRLVSTIGNMNISSTSPHNMTNFSPLTAEMCWRVCGTPAHFNGFRVFASLLQRRRSPKANQTLHDVWLSPGLVYYIYTFSGALVRRKIHFTSKSCVLLYWQRYCTALQPRASNIAAWYKEWNYGTFAERTTYIRLQRPSRWAPRTTL